MNQDIRWKQRFQNFKNAYLFLQKGVEMDSYDDLQRAGLIQSFEFTFELAWKTLKDYLASEGIVTQYPREIIKKSFEVELIENGHLWISMLDKRNELSHTYNDEQAQKAIELVKNEYFAGIKQVFEKLSELCSD